MRGYRRTMRKLSAAVGVVAAGALALGSVGMASAGPTGAQSHAAHALHGQTGENPDLAPRRAGNLPKLVGIVNDNRDIEISDRTPTPWPLQDRGPRLHEEPQLAPVRQREVHLHERARAPVGGCSRSG